MASVTSQAQRAHVIASKHGLFGLIKALAYELGPYNVRAALVAKQLDAVVAEFIKNGPTAEELEAIPMRRAGKNAEVANVAVFLASDQSSYVTGDRVLCAGGKYM